MDGMISPQELRRIARARKLALDLVEKDYVLGWLLFAISSSSIANRLAFKGGTALSKVYFPGEWRLSEDLDFTLIDVPDFGAVKKSLVDEVPRALHDAARITAEALKTPYTNPDYLQCRIQYVGPVSKNTAKVEVSKEDFLGEVVKKDVPLSFDYPDFSVIAYSLDNILAEKIRTLLERGKVRDYYDVWRLLKTKRFDRGKVKSLFLKKCQAKNVIFSGTAQFFPTNLANSLRPYLKIGLTRLTDEPLPKLEEMLDELQTSLTRVLD